MARVNGGIATMLSGKVEGMVYVQLNGQTFTRRAPRRKKDSVTPGMLLNQKRFKAVNEFCFLFKDSIIPQIWKGVSPKMSGYALFLKSNMAAFAPDGSLEDKMKIRLSTGKLSFPQGLEARRTQDNIHQIEVLWIKEMHVGGIHLKDELMVISARDGAYTEITATGILRNDLKGTFELPSFPVPQAPGPMHLYLFFNSKDHREYSESVCFEV